MISIQLNYKRMSVPCDFLIFFFFLFLCVEEMDKEGGEPFLTTIEPFLNLIFMLQIIRDYIIKIALMCIKAR